MRTHLIQHKSNINCSVDLCVCNQSTTWKKTNFQDLHTKSIKSMQIICKENNYKLKDYLLNKIYGDYIGRIRVIIIIHINQLITFFWVCIKYESVCELKSSRYRN